MKRIKYACLEQTICFVAKDNISGAAAEYEIKNELESFKEQLTKNKIKFRIISEEKHADGSIIVMLKKQYSGYDCGNYFE